MKKNLFIVSLIALLATSCEHDTLPTYSDVDRIYFEYAAWETPGSHGYDSKNPDQRKISFGYDKVTKTDSITKIKVQVMGNVASNDRPITAKVILSESTAVEGEDFEILPSVVPANELIGTLNIKLKNTEKIQTNTLTVKIMLTPNEYFHVDYTYVLADKNRFSGTEFKINFDAKKDKPSLWAASDDGKISPPNLNNYFGPFSNVKLDVLCSALGYSRDWFEYDAETENPKTVFNSRIPSSQFGFGLLIQVNHYLKRWKDEHDGQPLLDENGVEVKMGMAFI
ncbi:MAG: DUF4843 domain-containing protein [Dysgonamonadaceae bacterium]|jgi:hypothetical protein|nr:DUF4843 domain-containing protein [Dysgonamonadaceae bacterium]